MSAGKPFLSVVVPTRHRNDLLSRCLACLAPSVQTLAPEFYEVIVTDDGSVTTAQEMLRLQYPGSKWIAGPRLGPAANRNNGASVAAGEWLVFTDDDCIPDAGWLAAYRASIAMHPKSQVFEGRVYADRPRKSLAETAPLNESGGYLWSCNFAIRADLFRQMRGFDERFLYAAMEDVELATRLKKEGHTFVFVAGASICHPWRESGGWERMKQHQMATLCYLDIHPDEIRRINSLYYLRIVLHSLIRETIPGIRQMKGAGLGNAALQHLAYLEMAFRLCPMTLRG